MMQSCCNHWYPRRGNDNADGHWWIGNVQFADAMVRLLTGGAVFGAPLAYDAAAGTVPPTDSPLLATLRAFMQLSWCASPPSSPPGSPTLSVCAWTCRALVPVSALAAS